MLPCLRVPLFPALSWKHRTALEGFKGLGLRAESPNPKAQNPEPNTLDTKSPTNLEPSTPKCRKNPKSLNP